MTDLRPDPDVIRQHVAALTQRPGEVREVRLLDYRRSHRDKPHREVGYFDDAEAVAREIATRDWRWGGGAHVTPNAVNPVLLARANNRIDAFPKNATGDGDVARYQHLVVDCDATRPSGVPASDLEMAAALCRRDRVVEVLADDFGWPRPVAVIDSGNGGHAVWRVDVPADRAGVALVGGVLAALADRFDDAAVTIDRSVANPSHVMRLAGTPNRKGDGLPDRPHRLVTGRFDEDAGTVSAAMLRAVAATRAEAEPPQPGRPGSSLDVPALLIAAGYGYREHAKDGTRIYELDRCPHSDAHLDGAAVFQRANGAVGFRCFHNSCAGAGWADVRERFGLPPRQERPPVAVPPPPPPPRRVVLPGTIITAPDLLRKRFADPRWAVPGIVAEGATLLIGGPKKGKSWLLLGLGIAIAAGGVALGKIAVEQGEVLLLCLEDSERRLQERMWRILDGERAPPGLHLVTAWPRLDQGGDLALVAWLDQHPATRLVGVDVLARMRPPSREKGDLYQRDYETMAAFKRVADGQGVPHVVAHHSRKARADDPLDVISGTHGLGAAADAALILTRERGRADGNLYVRGRDVPELDYALSFDPVFCQWSLLGDAALYRLSAGRAEVVALLADRSLLSPKQIAEALDANPGNIRVLLHRMAQQGQIVNLDGLYALPPDMYVTGVTPPENPRSDADFGVTGGCNRV